MEEEILVDAENLEEDNIVDDENLVDADEVEKEVSAEELSESTGVKEYIQSNPELAKAYNESGATEEDINKIIESNPELRDALNYLNNNNVKLTDDIMEPEPEIDEEELEEADNSIEDMDEGMSEEEIDSTVNDLQGDEEEEEEIAEDVDSMF